MSKLNQKGVVPVFVLIAGLGLLAFFFLSSSAPFRDKLFAQLFPKPLSHAASEPIPGSGKAVLSLLPSSGNLGKGCRVSLEVKLDTGGAKTDGTDALIFYDPTKMSVIGIRPGTIYADYPASYVDSQNNRIIISGLAKVGNPYSGSGTFATIDFAIPAGAASGTTSVRFDFDPNNKTKTIDSNVVESGTATEILDQVIDGSYVIGDTGSCFATPTPTPILTGNLLSNPGFETGSVSPWIGWQANASLSSIARSGGYGGKAAFTIGTYGNAYTIGQDPVSTNATAGQTYYATAWVRGEGSSIGKTIQVTIRERGSTQTWEISSDAGVKLSNSWQQISVNRAMAESGSALDVYIGQTNAVTGDYFYIDDSSFSTATPTSTPTPDTISPTVSITNPQNGATVRKNRKVLITAKAADNVKVSKVEFYIANSLKCLVLTPNSSGQYSCSWNVPKQPEATYSITAKAYDPSGNTANQVINVTAR